MTTLLTQLPKCWDFRWEPPELAKIAFCSSKGREKKQGREYGGVFTAEVSLHFGGGTRQMAISVDRVAFVR